jgi:hypothetical protein
MCSQFVEFDPSISIRRVRGHGRVTRRYDLCEQSAATDDVNRLSGADPIETSPGSRS